MVVTAASVVRALTDEAGIVPGNLAGVGVGVPGVVDPAVPGPDDDQDGTADCHDGFLLATPSGNAPVAFAQDVSVRPTETAASPRTLAR